MRVGPKSNKYPLKRKEKGKGYMRIGDVKMKAEISYLAPSQGMLWSLQQLEEARKNSPIHSFGESVAMPAL